MAEITLYGKPGCPRCKVLGMKLDKKGIPFTKIEDEALLVQIGEQNNIASAPILCIDGQYYDLNKASQLINQWEVK